MFVYVTQLMLLFVEHFMHSDYYICESNTHDKNLQLAPIICYMVIFDFIFDNRLKRKKISSI